MKTKNKILLFTLIFPFIIVVMVILSIRNSFNEETVPSPQYSEDMDSSPQSYDINDFENISMKGFWNVNIIHDDYYEIELMVPEKMLREITVEKNGRMLILSTEKNTFSLFSLGKKPAVNITLPSLSNLNIKGVANILISDFDNAETSISMDGVLNITGKNCDFDQFSLSGNGVMNVSMNDVPVTNAHFNYSGIYNITMFMNGGSLTGRLDGIGRMVASGEISENNIFVKEPGYLKITD